jgi:hypothetical protein
MTHDFETAISMNAVNEIDGFFARASASPVRNRTKSGPQRSDQFDFAEEGFLAFVCFWRKKFN